MSLLNQTYKPYMGVGQVSAKVFNTPALHIPIGNVLKLSLEHKEDVKRMEDMRTIGGGSYAEVRRVTEVTLKMELADFNVTNLARCVLGDAAVVGAGSITNVGAVAQLGGLIRLEHINPTALTLKMGPDQATATLVNAANNFVVRPEGVLLLPTAQQITEGSQLWLSYDYGEYVAIEALMAKPAELSLVFGGLNAADSGKPMVIDIFRASQGITKSLALIGNDFGKLDVEGTLLMDYTKTSIDASQFYRASMV
jgi:hypothetical protein